MQCGLASLVPQNGEAGAHFLSAHERKPNKNPSFLHVPAPLTGTNRRNAEAGSKLPPLSGEPTDSGAGFAFLPGTGHLGGKRCASSEAPCGSQQRMQCGGLPPLSEQKCPTLAHSQVAEVLPSAGAPVAPIPLACPTNFHGPAQGGTRLSSLSRSAGSAPPWEFQEILAALRAVRSR